MAESAGGALFTMAAITVAGVLVLIVGLLMPELLSDISYTMGGTSGGTSTTLEKQETYSKDDYGL